jgi:rod shape-determining protein MreC
LLITDPRHSIPVEVARNGLKTIAVGTGSTDYLELRYLTGNSDIRLGDTLLSSGLGELFPRGYPVAEVVHVSHAPGKPFSQILARPIAEMDRIREVLLVWTLSQQTADSLPADDIPTTGD